MEEFQSKHVEELFSEVKPGDVDTLDQLARIRDRSSLINRVLKAWSKDREADLALRESYGRWLLGLLVGQVVVINVVFFLVGFGCISVDESLAQTFLVGVFVELTALTLAVVKSLFYRQKNDLINSIPKF